MPQPELLSSPTAMSVLQPFLERALPGESAAIQRVRFKVAEFASNPLARSLLLSGPTCAGKSTVARVVAVAKRIAPLSTEKSSEVIPG